MKDTKKPLLLQGVDATTCTATLKVSNASGTFIKNRGMINWIDFMVDETTGTNGNTIGFNGGSVGVLVQHTAQLFRRSIGAFLHRFIPVCIDSGQSYNIEYSTQNNAATFDGKAIMHVYYENPFDTDEFRAKLDADALTLQRQTFRIDLSSGIGSKFSEKTITVPSDQGDVCAIALTYDGDPLDAMFANKFSIDVDGVNVVLNACAYLTLRDCTRKGLIMPILIERESDITVKIDDSATTGQTGIYALTLFFDDSKLSR